MWEKVREYLLVTVIAVLIWLYAESENVTSEERAVSIELAPATRDMVITSDQPTKAFSVTFRGNSGQHNDLKQLLHQGALTIEMRAGDEPLQQFNLRSALANHPKIAQIGASVLETRPETVTASVEKLVKLDMPITVVAAGEALLRDITILPETVVVRLPGSSAKVLGDQPNAEARIAANQLQNLAVNQQHTLNGVAVAIPAIPKNTNINVTPPTVDVTFTIKKLTKELVLAPIAVRLVAPLTEVARYEIIAINEDEKLVRDVKISGPNDLIEQIESKQIKVWADLRMQGEDLARAEGKESVSIVPHIELPSGVSIVQPPRPIKLKIKRLKSEETGL